VSREESEHVEQGEPVTSARESIHVCRFETVMGVMTLAASSRGVVACTLPDRDGGEELVRAFLERKAPGAEMTEGVGPGAAAVEAAKSFLAGKRTDLDLPLDMRGTPFQLQCWSVLREIPYGSTISYKRLAERVGRPTAFRACGAANGANPLPLFVPCHRVVASDGSLQGFGGGLPLKRRLLELEARVGGLFASS